MSDNLATASFQARLVQADVTHATLSERQAALTLHRLLPGDRQWLLQRLPGQAQQRLQALLSELDDLKLSLPGGTPDELQARIFDTAISATDNSHDPAMPSLLQSPLPPLLAHQRAAVLALLNHSTTSASHYWMTALLPSEHPDFLPQLSPARRALLQQSTIDHPLQPVAIALRHWLIRYADAAHGTKPSHYSKGSV